MMMEEHSGMMMEEMGPMLFGMPLVNALMIASGIFYFICAAIIWKPYKQEKNDLMGALLAFLIYQAFAMILMGIGMQTHNMLYDNLGSLAVFVGSVYMLKFPFTVFPEKTRKIFFYLAMIAALVLFGWFMMTPEREMMLMKFILWYDLIVNGIVVGFFIFFFGLKANERAVKVKAMGGGVGVATCCIAANAAMIMGAMIVSSVFQFLAPIIIIFSIVTGRKLQKRAGSPS